jgi:uncharacterized protein YqeY
MGLKERLKSDLTEAIRSRDEIRAGTIRMALTSITNEEVSGKEARVLSDAEIITVLSREAKKRREAAEAYESAGSKERADREKDEGKVIAEYLPTQLTDAELQDMITAAITETGASSPSGMGQVMKVLSPKIAGRADGAKVSAAVKAALS